MGAQGLCPREPLSIHMCLPLPMNMLSAFLICLSVGCRPATPWDGSLASAHSLLKPPSQGGCPWPALTEATFQPPVMEPFASSLYRHCFLIYLFIGFLFSRVDVYECMCTCMCLHVCRVRRSNSVLLFRYHPPGGDRVSHWVLGLADPSRLDGWRAPVIYLSLLAQLWDE